MTYRIEQLDPAADQAYRKENYVRLVPGAKLRCQVCNSIYWRVFVDRGQCMGCRGFTRLETEHNSVNNGERCLDLRAVNWIKYQVSRYKDGRVRDPITKRSEFVVCHNYLKARVGGVELFIRPYIKGSWYIGKIEEKFKAMTPSQIMKYLKNSLEK